MPPSWTPYDSDACAFADLYESFTFESVHANLLDLLPPMPALALDVGSGSGRDAAGLARLGYQVTACEPSPALRREALKRHPGAGIRWLPGADLDRPASGFAFILLAGVWMHVQPEDRSRAMDRLACLLAPEGRLALSLRHGPEPEGRGFHPISSEEVESLASTRGLHLLRKHELTDNLGRPGVTWTTLVFQAPG
jgi:SAM-dependent methyltransferase